MKPQKSKSKQGGLSTGRMRKDDLRPSRQSAGRNMVFWSEPTAKCIGLQAGKNDTVVAIPWKEG